jgi:hypothetical protein
VAAKQIGMSLDGQEAECEYRRLKSLGQLYSTWHDTTSVYGEAFLISPFVDGETIPFFTDHLWIKTELRGDNITFDGLPAGMHLIKSMLAQLTYIAERGIRNHDICGSNIMISRDYKDLVLIDFGGYGDKYTTKQYTAERLPALVPSDFYVGSYAFYCHYFLGTRLFREEIKREEVKEPAEILQFLKIIPFAPGERPSPSLIVFNNAVQELEKALQGKGLLQETD